MSRGDGTGGCGGGRGGACEREGRGWRVGGEGEETVKRDWEGR